MIFYLLPSSFILVLCSNTLTLKSIFEYIRQKLIKNMRLLKFHPGMKCLHVFFSFFNPGMKCHLCLSSRDEVSSRQKRVNCKRRCTIGRNDFIPGRVSSWDEISRVNTLWIVFRTSLNFVIDRYYVNESWTQSNNSVWIWRMIVKETGDYAKGALCRGFSK